MKLRGISFETKRVIFGYEMSVTLNDDGYSFIHLLVDENDDKIGYDYEFRDVIDFSTLQRNHPQVHAEDWQLIERQYNKLHGVK